LVKIFNSRLPTEYLIPKINNLKAEFNSLSNPFHEYLRNIPKLVERTAWYMESFLIFYAQADKIYDKISIKKDITHIVELLQTESE